MVRVEEETTEEPDHQQSYPTEGRWEEDHK